MRMGEKGREVRVGVIGLGSRSVEQIRVLCAMPDVTIAAVCDGYADRVEEARARIEKETERKPEGEADWRALVARADIEAVVIMTSWQTHAEIAIAAMKAGKQVGLEVGGASSIEECWALVRAGEETGRVCMLLENCCYGREEMALLQMVRAGLFGELVHCQGGYEHDLRDEIGLGDVNRHYRQEHFLRRNGELYPTHELGPIAKYLNLNRGNRMLTLCSMASKAVGERAWLREHRTGEAIANVEFKQGDIVTTMISCAGGETILLTHDCTLPRPYSRGGRVQGTRGVWMEDNRSIFIEGRSPVDPSHWTHSWESDAKYMEEFCHPLWREYEAFGKRGGHGGMDYLALRAFIECVQEGTIPPIDVYDAASWMAITALSEASVAMGGAPVPVPDFTNGAWLRARAKNTGTYALD